MIVIIVVALICAILFGFGDGDVWSGILGLVFGAVIGAFLALLIGMAVYHDKHWETGSHVQLQSLVDGSDIRGSFFLGSGVINQVSVFTWYEQSSGNSYNQRRADADLSTVHFISRGNPYYVRSAQYYDDGPVLDSWGWRLDGGETGAVQYDFYVPRGTIKHNYELDAQ